MSCVSFYVLLLFYQKEITAYLRVILYEAEMGFILQRVV